MTGPEHYREAEALLDSCGARTLNDTYSADFDDRTAQVVAAAQVHATLALAAAVGCAIKGSDTVAWEATAGPQSTPTPPTALDQLDGHYDTSNHEFMCACRRRFSDAAGLRSHLDGRHG